MVILELLVFFYSLKLIIYPFILIAKRKLNRKDVSPASSVPLSVDLILPMYNEETVVVNTINNLLEITYPDFNIIVVDDGSTDNTMKVVTEYFHSHPKVKIIHQENSGKAFALNNAISVSKSDIVVCLDADTIVRPDVIDKFIPFFDDEHVAGVSGYLKVGNRSNLLTNVQYIEYITNPNFERMVFEPINGILHIPGPIAAFRRSVLVEVGGYTLNMLTEDFDLSFKIHDKNYVIRNAPDAIAYTEAPVKLEMFLKQRVRWRMGTIQVLCKYHKKFLSHPNRLLVCIAIPYRWLFGVILPVVTPLADYIFAYNLLFGNPYAVLPYYLTFILIDALISIGILIQKKESPVFMLFIVFQRFLLRHLMFFAYIHILYRYLRGNLFEWDKIVRHGKVKLD